MSRLTAGALLATATVAVLASPARAQPVIRVRHGVLTVVGTNRSDTIVVTTHLRRVTVQVNTKRFVIRPPLKKIRMDGRAGDDDVRLLPDGGTTLPAVVSGGAGNDVLVGYIADRLQLPRPSTSSRATSGRTSSGASVLLDGGDGDDRLVGADRMLGGTGNDFLEGSQVPLFDAYQLDFDAGPGDDLVLGAEHTTGDLGDGNDTYFGWRSDARYWVPGGADTSSAIRGGAGNDTISGADGSMTFDAGAGEDQVNGGWGPTMGTLGDGDDRYVGSYGQSSVQGGAGNDLLRSRLKDALFEGDAGADVFVADRSYDGFYGPTVGAETVTDFGTDADIVYFGDGLSVHSGTGTATVTVWDGTDDVGTITAANGHLWSAADFG